MRRAADRIEQNPHCFGDLEQQLGEALRNEVGQ
jgi:hypothetical protein